MSLLWIVMIAALGALAFAGLHFIMVKKMEEGLDVMSEIASAIRVGANAFIIYEYKIITVVVLIIAAALVLLMNWHSSLSFTIGVLMSAAAGWAGMKIATYANVRVANRARETKDIGKTLKTAFRGGSVMGQVGGQAVLGRQ